MSDTKWTSGPWVVEPSIPEEGVECYWLMPESGERYHSFADIHGPQRGEAEANAHLIAAAPCLYQALEESNRHLVGEFGINHELVKRNRAALAKARGES